MSGYGAEDSIVAQWLTTTFEADIALNSLLSGGVWSGPAADQTPYPILRFDMQSSVPVRGVGPTEIMANMLWLIRGVTEGASYAPLTPIANRIHALLQGVDGLAVVDGTIVACVREQGWRTEMIQAGRDFRSLGGIYRIYVQPY